MINYYHEECASNWLSHIVLERLFLYKNPIGYIIREEADDKKREAPQRKEGGFILEQSLHCRKEAPIKVKELP